MKVLFDCRYVRTERHDGISRYSAELVRELARLTPVEMLISDEAQLANLPTLPWHLISSQTAAGEPWVAREVNRLVERRGADIVFSPMQTMGSRGRRYKLVLTVHDLIYYRHRTPPRDLPWYVKIAWRLYHLSWWPQRVLLNGADAVVAVSETTRGLITAHHLTRRPVHVVYNAAADPSPKALAEAPARTPPVDVARQSIRSGRAEPGQTTPGGAVPGDVMPGGAAPGDTAPGGATPGDAAPGDATPGDAVAGQADAPPSRLLVHMGQFMPYKNVDTLVRAVNELPDDYELHLMSRVTDAERARLAGLAPQARLVFHDGASDADYEATLLRAHALVTTSWDEGFGIPIIEAMRLGTPVVASDIPIFHEVGGAAAVFVDPASPSDVARGIRSLESTKVWTAASRTGLAQAAKFSWEASARALYDVLAAARSQ